MENPIKMDDLGENPLFSETPTYAKHVVCWLLVDFFCRKRQLIGGLFGARKNVLQNVMVINVIWSYMIIFNLFFNMCICISICNTSCTYSLYMQNTHAPKNHVYIYIYTYVYVHLYICTMYTYIYHIAIFIWYLYKYGVFVLPKDPNHWSLKRSVGRKSPRCSQGLSWDWVSGRISFKVGRKSFTMAIRISIGSGGCPELHCYCWWTKSCTTKDDDYPIISRVLTIPGGAGFCPSTVFQANLGWSMKKPASCDMLKKNSIILPSRCF